MTNEEVLVGVALKGWNDNLERANKLFASKTDQQLNQEIAPGKNRLIYLWGHLTAVHDRMIDMLGLGPRLHPEFDEPFLTSADRASAAAPSAEEVRKAWSEVNGKLSQGFASLRPQDWLQKHSAVSAEDFAKEPLRNRFAILLSRTSHLGYHLGQAILISK